MPGSPVHPDRTVGEYIHENGGKWQNNDMTSHSWKHQHELTDPEREWEEIQIDIGWGILRGKARGSGPQLMLGLHGWLDNANTFDLVVPYIPENVRFLSLDLPGHGLSDHFPPGYVYDPRGYVGAVKKAINTLGWKHFIFLGHSMGAVVGIIYSSVFPEDVDAFISVDIIKPWSVTPENYAPQLRKYFDKYFDSENKIAQPELIYEEEHLVKKTIEGSKSLDDRGARILLKRGSRRAKNSQGLILNRDLRAKPHFVGFIGFEEWREMARLITCPLLIIKAKDGHHDYESQERNKTMLSAFKQDCSYYCYHEVSGKHHIHLTEADIIGRLILTFLEEYKNLSIKNGSLKLESLEEDV